MNLGTCTLLLAFIAVVSGSQSLKDRLAAIKNRKKGVNPQCDTTPCTFVLGPCSASCGPGVQLPRIVKKKGKCGKCSLPGAKPCMLKSCTADCEWKSWTSFSSCSRSCGGGKILRSREKTNSRGGGAECVGEPREERSCNNICCPDQCNWSEWSDLGSCSQSCGGGMQKKTRKMLAGCASGTCPVPEEDRFISSIVPCNVEECVDVSWGEWSSCSVKCGGGHEIRSRNQVNEDGVIWRTNETRKCNEHCCPVDCQWKEWSPWIGCSRTCGGGGHQIRVRDVINNATCGGKLCVGQTLVHQSCTELCCPSECEVSQWSTWTACTVSCGPHGLRHRTRHVTKREECGGNCELLLMESTSCNTGCCPIDCKSSPWSTWTACSSTCGFGGQQARVRNITLPSSCGGVQCSDGRMQTRSCNEICMNDGVLVNNTCQCPSTWTGSCCQQDVDECEIHGDEICHEYGECVNVENGFQCRCHSGYHGDGFNCTDMNECSEDTHNCGVNSECRNSDGSYDCVCKLGFHGDGRDCQASPRDEGRRNAEVVQHDQINPDEETDDEGQKDAPTFIIICAVIISICVIIAIIAFLKYRHRRMVAKQGSYLVGNSRVHYTKSPKDNNQQEDNVQGHFNTQ